MYYYYISENKLLRDQIKLKIILHLHIKISKSCKICLIKAYICKIESIRKTEIKQAELNELLT